MSASGSLADRETTYRALIAASDLESLHDLIARKGPEVLDLPFPYLVVAARNRLRDSLRRKVHEVPLGSEEGSVTPAPSVWDPLEVALAKDELRRTLETLARMDDRDVLVVWLAARGVADEKIVAEWDSLGFEPRHPTLSAIRKRRERARAELRRRTAVGR